MNRIQPNRIRTVGSWKVRTSCIRRSASTDAILSGITEAAVRLQLAEEDNTAHAEGNISLHEVTPAGMVVEGLLIEEQQ